MADSRSWIVAKFQAGFSTRHAEMGLSRFKRTLASLSKFTEEHVRPDDIPQETVDGLRRYFVGKSSVEHAEALKLYAEEEEKRIQNTISEQTLQNKISQDDARTIQENARANQEMTRARMAIVEEILKRVELFERLRALNALPLWKPDGTMIILRVPGDCDWEEVKNSLFTQEELEAFTKSRG